MTRDSRSDDVLSDDPSAPHILLLTNVTPLSTWGGMLPSGAIMPVADIDRPGVSVDDLRNRNIAREATDDEVRAFYERYPYPKGRRQEVTSKVEAKIRDVTERIRAARKDSDRAEVCLILVAELHQADSQWRIANAPRPGVYIGLTEEAVIRDQILENRRLIETAADAKAVRPLVRDLIQRLMVASERRPDLSSSPLQTLIDVWESQLDNFFAYMTAKEHLKRLQWVLKAEEEKKGHWLGKTWEWLHKDILRVAITAIVAALVGFVLAKIGFKGP